MPNDLSLNGIGINIPMPNDIFLNGIGINIQLQLDKKKPPFGGLGIQYGKRNHSKRQHIIYRGAKPFRRWLAAVNTKLFCPT